MAMIPRRRGKAAEAYHFLAETLRELEFHLRGRIEESGLIPSEWEEIAARHGPMPKVKVNLWVEGDVVKFFRGTGQGWSSRMAEVLRIFVLSRRAGLLRGAEGVDYTPLTGEERAHRLAMLREALALSAETLAEERAAKTEQG
ncbi:MAG: hypothetical protein RLZZ528_979 [Pseudomonadota bacterium]|jgi:uncharacterized protein (DUF4415 family)